MDTPHVFAGCETISVGDFVEEFAGCGAQERLGASPVDFRVTRIGDFYRAVQEVEAPWGIDHPFGRYVFHNNLVARKSRGSVEELERLFDRHQPTEDFVELSRAAPCVGMRITFGGPNSGTPPHAHGWNECQLLAGTKHWWLWPRPADALVEWISRCSVATNRIEFWRQHIAPVFAGRTGDVTGELFDLLERLTGRGLFDPVDPDHADRTFEYSTRALGNINRFRAAGEGILAEYLAPIELTQRAGEIVILPELWGHAVRNEGWHVAVIYELQLQDSPVPRTGGAPWTLTESLV